MRGNVHRMQCHLKHKTNSSVLSVCFEIHFMTLTLRQFSGGDWDKHKRCHCTHAFCVTSTTAPQTLFASWQTFLITAFALSPFIAQIAQHIKTKTVKEQDLRFFSRVWQSSDEVRHPGLRGQPSDNILREQQQKWGGHPVCLTTTILVT